MSGINSSVLEKVTNLQNQIWQTVSLTVSEAANAALNFTTPLTVSASTADLYAEMGAPRLVVQFAFTSMPENSQVLLIDQESFADLAGVIRNETVRDIDEALVADVRPAIEAIVQGVCLAIGNVKNNAVVASGLSIRFQIFSFPPNLSRAAGLVRTNIAISGEGVGGTVVWLMDDETAHYIAGVQLEEENDNFARSAGGAGNGRAASVAEDAPGLELLMDIPLEISVELGRVRMLLKEVIDLGAGSIVEIDKAAGEPVDVMVNGRLVARGEVVVIEDNFGVRITEVLSPAERMARLNEVA